MFRYEAPPGGPPRILLRSTWEGEIDARVVASWRQVTRRHHGQQELEVVVEWLGLGIYDVEGEVFDYLASRDRILGETSMEQWPTRTITR